MTGEAVPLELRLAKMPSRALAVLIDLAILFIVGLIVVNGLAPVVDSVDPAAQAAIQLTSTAVLFVAVQTTIEVLTKGRSVGKIALGLRVVRDDGGPIRIRHALVRWLAAIFVDFVLIGSVAIVCSLLNEKGKRVGDLMAGTVVVRERVPSSLGPLPPLRPHLMRWAESTEIGPIPDGLSAAARNYIGRSAELAPGVRDAMGAQLAADMSQYINAAPPPGTPPWAFLAAVLGERHRREMIRMQNARQAHAGQARWQQQPAPPHDPPPRLPPPTVSSPAPDDETDRPSTEFRPPA